MKMNNDNHDNNKDGNNDVDNNNNSNNDVDNNNNNNTSLLRKVKFENSSYNK